jgi:large repetitive protein
MKFTSVLTFLLTVNFIIICFSRELHGFGLNTNGQLGVGDTTSKNFAQLINITALGAAGVFQIAAGKEHSVIIGNDGVLYAFGRNQRGQLGDGTTTTRTRAVKSDILKTGWRLVDASLGDHSVAVLGSNEIYTWGFHSTVKKNLKINFSFRVD